MSDASGNAADYFVDRHVREGRGERLGLHRSARSLTYGELHEASARFAAGLRGAGIERERRIALVMLDTVDFPIAFWGALRAGVVPVPINTLLPADITGYILADSRAARWSSRRRCCRRCGRRRGRVGRSSSARPDGGRGGDFDTFLATATDRARPAECSPDEVAFWLYSSGSTGAPKGVRHVHASLRATADTYGTQVLGIEPDDLMFSAAKLFFAYGLGNSMTFPMSVGAGAVLLPDRPTPDAVLATMRQLPADDVRRRADPLRRPAGASGIGRGAGSDRLRRCISAGEPLPEHIGARWREHGRVSTFSTASARPRCCTSSCRTGPPTSATAPPASRCRATRCGSSTKPVREVARWRAGRTGGARPQRRRGLLEPARANRRRTFRGEWTHTGDTYIARRRRLLPLLRAQ